MGKVTQQARLAASSIPSKWTDPELLWAMQQPGGNVPVTEIKHAGIRKGLGAFSTAEIPTDAVIAIARGPYVPSSHMDPLHGCMYQLSVMHRPYKRYVVMDLSHSDSTIRYVNTADSLEERNVYIQWRGPIAVLRALRDIRAGEELLLDYELLHGGGCCCTVDRTLGCLQCHAMPCK